MCQQSYFNSRRRDSVREGEKSDEVIQNVIKNIFYAIFYYVPTPDTRPGQWGERRLKTASMMGTKHLNVKCN